MLRRRKGGNESDHEIEVTDDTDGLRLRGCLQTKIGDWRHLASPRLRRMSAQFGARHYGNYQFPNRWPDNHLPTTMLKDADLRTDVPTMNSYLAQVGSLWRGDIFWVSLVFELALRSHCHSYFTQQAPPAQHEPDAQQAVSQAVSQAHGPPTSQAQPRSLQTQFSHLQLIQQSQQEADV